MEKANKLSEEKNKTETKQFELHACYDTKSGLTSCGAEDRRMNHGFSDYVSHNYTMCLSRDVPRILGGFGWG